MREDEVFDEIGRSGSVHYRRVLETLESPPSSTRRCSRSCPPPSSSGRTVPGSLKHLVDDHMGTAEFALDVYTQVIEPGEHSGIHPHFSGEITYILEGEGYELHQDPKIDLDVEYTWTCRDEPKRFEWQKNVVYIPSYVNHQHFAGPNGRVRLLSATARFIKALGLDGLEQIESL